MRSKHRLTGPAAKAASANKSCRVNYGDMLSIAQIGSGDEVQEMGAISTFDNLSP
jgi:hypothetical protein